MSKVVDIAHEFNWSRSSTFKLKGALKKTQKSKLRFSNEKKIKKLKLWTNFSFSSKKWKKIENKSYILKPRLSATYNLYNLFNKIEF